MNRTRVCTVFQVNVMLAMALLAGAVMAQSGCDASEEDAKSQGLMREAVMQADGTELETEAAPGPIEPAFSDSFWATCRPFKYWYSPDGIGITEAYSDSCRRRNGTWGGPTFYGGYCTGDVANCNGVLRCGSC